MADLSKVKIGDATYNLKDAQARTDINTAVSSLNAEISRAKAAEASLSTAIGSEATARASADAELKKRIENLEARGRFLSNWNASTGLPTDYPTIPEGATYPYKYEYKVGDYYIVGTVASGTGTNYRPDGAFITKESASSDWTVGKAAFTAAEVGVGDYFICSTITGTGDDKVATWVHVSNSQKTVSFANIAGSPYDNTNLSTELNLKADKATTIAGLSIGSSITSAALQSALGLEDLAYADYAAGSTSYTPAGSVTGTATAAGTVTLNEFAETDATAALSSVEYTPAGSVTGEAIKGGSISVTLSQSKVSAEVTKGDYTPSGDITIAGATSGDKGVYTVTGTNNASEVSFSGGTTVAVLSSIKTNAVLPTFSEGAFTPAAFSEGFYSAGASATWTGASYSAPTLGSASTASFASKVMKAVVDSTDSEMLVFSYADSADTAVASNFATAVTAQGTFSAGSVSFGTFDGGRATVIDLAKFSGGSKAADTWNAGVSAEFNTTSVIDNLGTATAAAQSFTGGQIAAKFAGASQKDLIVTGVSYNQATISSATFSGVAASLGFSGKKAAQNMVTGVTYKKATAANGATFTGASTSINANFAGTQATISINVTPV